MAVPGTRKANSADPETFETTLEGVSEVDGSKSAPTRSNDPQSAQDQPIGSEPDGAEGHDAEGLNATGKTETIDGDVVLDGGVISAFDGQQYNQQQSQQQGAFSAPQFQGDREGQSTAARSGMAAGAQAMAESASSKSGLLGGASSGMSVQVAGASSGVTLGANVPAGGSIALDASTAVLNQPIDLAGLENQAEKGQASSKPVASSMVDRSGLTLATENASVASMRMVAREGGTVAMAAGQNVDRNLRGDARSSEGAGHRTSGSQSSVSGNASSAPAVARADSMNAALRAERQSGGEAKIAEPGSFQPGSGTPVRDGDGELLQPGGQRSQASGHTRSGAQHLPTAAAASAQTDAAETAPRTLSGVNKGLAVLANQRGGSLKMRLDPPSLGPLKLEMAIDAGRVRVQMQVASESARSLLGSNLNMLRTALEERGLTVEQLVVESKTSSGSSESSRNEARDQSGQDARNESRDQANHDSAQGRSRGRRDHGEMNGEPDNHAESQERFDQILQDA